MQRWHQKQGINSGALATAFYRQHMIRAKTSKYLLSSPRQRLAPVSSWPPSPPASILFHSPVTRNNWNNLQLLSNKNKINDREVEKRQSSTSYLLALLHFLINLLPSRTIALSQQPPTFLHCCTFSQNVLNVARHSSRLNLASSSHRCMASSWQRLLSSCRAAFRSVTLACDC